MDQTKSVPSSSSIVPHEEVPPFDRVLFESLLGIEVEYAEGVMPIPATWSNLKLE